MSLTCDSAQDEFQYPYRGPCQFSGSSELDRCQLVDNDDGHGNDKGVSRRQCRPMEKEDRQKEEKTKDKSNDMEKSLRDEERLL